MSSASSSADSEKSSIESMKSIMVTAKDIEELKKADPSYKILDFLEDPVLINTAIQKIKDSIVGQMCLICHSTPDIPVQLKETCGGSCCSKKVQLYCLRCVRQYFCLNQKKNDRPYSLRHIICSKTTNPMRLNAEKAYFIDESSMKLMDIFMKDPIKCRLCSEECPNRVYLWNHMRETCSKRTVKCSYCNTWAEPNDLLRHFQLGRCMSYKRHDEHLRRSAAAPTPATPASRTRPSEADEDSSDISSSEDEAEERRVARRLQEVSLRRLRAEERETELRRQESLRRREIDADAVNRRIEEEEIIIDSDARNHALLRRRREADNRRAEEEARQRADAEEHMALQLQNEAIW
jgi:hypothetical protein